MASCICNGMVSTKAGSPMMIGNTRNATFPGFCIQNQNKSNYSVKSSSLDPPDVGCLAETARISLTPQEVQEFGPKIQQVVEWFGQLQAVDLESIEPAIRSEIDGDNFREDITRTFENRDAIIAAIPIFEEPYIKVPKVLNKEQQ